MDCQFWRLGRPIPMPWRNLLTASSHGRTCDLPKCWDYSHASTIPTKSHLSALLQWQLHLNRDFEGEKQSTHGKTEWENGNIILHSFNPRGRLPYTHRPCILIKANDIQIAGPSHTPALLNPMQWLLTAFRINNNSLTYPRYMVSYGLYLLLQAHLRTLVYCISPPLPQSFLILQCNMLHPNTRPVATSLLYSEA